MCVLCYRSLWPNDMFGQANEDDVIVLLNIYCTSLAEKRTGMYTIVLIVNVHCVV